MTTLFEFLSSTYTTISTNPYVSSSIAAILGVIIPTYLYIQKTYLPFLPAFLPLFNHSVVTVPAPDTDTSTQTHPRRLSTSKTNLSKTIGGVETVHDLVPHLANDTKRCNDPGFGFRKVLDIHTESKTIISQVPNPKTGKYDQVTKTWSYYELSSYYWWSYKQFAEKVANFGAGLRALGFAKNELLMMFAGTSVEWQLVAHGCFHQSMTIVTAYDTLGAQGLAHALNEGSLRVLFTNAHLLSMMPSIVSQVKTLTTILYSGEADPKHLKAIREAMGSKGKVLSLTEVMDLGVRNPAEPVRPDPEDLCCIMYTSGSTGVPKGVMLTHANVVATMAGCIPMLQAYIDARDDVYIAYLPLAHILEFVVEMSAFWLGLRLGYASPRTLTDENVRNCLGDLKELKPTLMAGVPLVWESIRKNILSKIKEVPLRRQRIFWGAYYLKWALMQLRLPTTLLDKIVFAKIAAATGGRLRYALSGGAPLAMDTQTFLSVCLCPIAQGYGMTEACGATAMQTLEAVKPGSVGRPFGSVEIKLVDVPDTHYSIRNKPNPQGEIWIRGGNVMKGYFKSPSKTAECITSDGWLMTGDIGEFRADGSLSIIDRKKNLVKLSNGEYIAIEKLEAVYKSCTSVLNLCVMADSTRNYPVALVVPNEKELKRIASSLPDPPISTDLDSLCANPLIIALIHDQLQQLAKQNNLRPVECLGRIHLVSDEWTTENGTLTAAQKIRRIEVAERYKDVVRGLYA